MSRIKIIIGTDNSAFDDGSREVKRILDYIADRLEAGASQFVVSDINGNVVGEVEVSDE